MARTNSFSFITRKCVLAALLCSTLAVLFLAPVSRAEEDYPANAVESLTFTAIANYNRMNAPMTRLFARYDDDYLFDADGFYRASLSFMKTLKFFAASLQYRDGVFILETYDYYVRMSERELNRDLDAPDYDLRVQFKNASYMFGRDTPCDLMYGWVRADGSAGSFIFADMAQTVLRLDIANAGTTTLCLLAVPDGSGHFIAVCCQYAKAQAIIAQKTVPASKLPAYFFTAKPTWAKLSAGCTEQLVATAKSAKYLVGKKTVAKYTY